MLAGVALRSLNVVDAAVTLPQFRLLAVIAELGPVPSGRWPGHWGLTRPTVTRLADRMVSAGHVTRGSSAEHRGVVTLDLTECGRRLVASADAWRRHELRIIARLAPRQQSAVIAALRLVVAAAGDDYGITGSPPVPL